MYDGRESPVRDLIDFFMGRSLLGQLNLSLLHPLWAFPFSKQW